MTSSRMGDMPITYGYVRWGGRVQRMTVLAATVVAISRQAVVTFHEVDVKRVYQLLRAAYGGRRNAVIEASDLLNSS
jgi:hypothetical protein